MKIILLCLLTTIYLFGYQKNSFNFGYQNTIMNYKEYDDNTLLDSEHNNFFDINGIYFEYTKFNYLKNNLNKYNEYIFNGSIVNGKTQYVGSLFDSKFGYGSSTNKTDNILIDIATYYKKHIIFDNFDFFIGLGLGYDFWKRNNEYYHWITYRPLIGFNYNYKKISIGFNYEYQKDLYSILYFSNQTYNLGSVIINKYNIPFKYKINKNFSLFLDFTIKKQTIEKSNIINLIYEPDSKTTNQYIKVGFIYYW